MKKKKLTQKQAWVRGEKVKILGVHKPEDKIQGELGWTTSNANTYVMYPDGETGYVRVTDIKLNP